VIWKKLAKSCLLFCARHRHRYVTAVCERDVV